MTYDLYRIIESGRGQIYLYPLSHYPGTSLIVMLDPGTLDLAWLLIQTKKPCRCGVHVD